MFFALLSMFVLPDYPRTTRWLSPREQAFAEFRLREDIGEEDGEKGTTLWQNAKMACVVMVYCPAEVDWNGADGSTV